MQRDVTIESGNQVMWYDEEKRTNLTGTVLYKVYWMLKDTMLLKVRTPVGDICWVEEKKCGLFVRD